MLMSKEVTQPSKPGEKEMAPQQLRHSKIIQKLNPNYANAAMVEDRVNEPKTCEASQNLACQIAMEEEIIALE